MKHLDNHLNRLQEFEPISMAAAGITFSAVNMILMAIRTYKEYFTKAARKCKDLPPKEKAMCMVRAKMLAKNAQLQSLKVQIVKCTKTKNPENCKAKIANKMQKLVGEIKFYGQRMKKMQKQGYQKK